MTVEVDVHLGKRLRFRRRQLGFTQQQVAHAIGVTFQQIQKYESGASKLSGARLWELAQVLDAPITYFYDGLPRKARPGGASGPVDATPQMR